MLVLLLCGAWLLIAGHAQVAPINDPAVTATANGTPDASGKDKPRYAPVPAVRGWSSGDELHLQHAYSGERVVLDPSHPEITLFFDETKQGSDVEFRYRLDPYDADWSVTRQRTAHYRRLPPGDFRFKVQARLPGQPWSAVQDGFHVEQKAFFFQTWYAYVLAAGILLALAVQVLRQRDQLLKGQIGMVLQERNRIASECHDTLMAGLAAISWQLEATSKLVRQEAGPAAEEDPALRSCELARSMVAHCQAEARRIIWDLRDSDEITNSLSSALADATSTYREREHPLTTLTVHGREVPISPGAVHHLVCIGQEAVTNAIRHADPKQVRVDLSYGEELLRLTITDDGCGLPDRAARTGHFGIPVMEERARKLGGTLHLASAAGSGTEVCVTVSFHHIHQPAMQEHNLVRWIGV